MTQTNITTNFVHAHTKRSTAVSSS